MEHLYKNLLSLMALSLIALTGFSQNLKYCGFDGSNDYIKYSDDATLGRMDGATDYTIEAWIYPLDGTVAEYDRVLQRYYSFNIQMYDGNNDGKVRDWYFVAIDGSGNNHYFNTEGDATLTLDTWNHIAVICNSTAGTLKLYVNGSDVTQSGGYSNYTLRSSHSNDNLYIGQKGNSASYFGGYIDEVRIKNVAESPSNLHYQPYDNQYNSDSYTAALFHFNESSGTSTLNEASGTNATLYNGTSRISWDAHVHLPLAYEWLGSSSDWATGSNWNAGSVPSSTNDVLIPSGTSNDPVVGSSSSVSARNLKILSGATLSVSSGGTLSITGTLNNLGTYTNNGTAEYHGSSSQDISGGTFNNLTINNSSGVSLSGNVTVNGTLSLTSGIITTSSANLLTLGSSASVSGGSSTAFVDGPIAKTGSSDFVFPCGDVDKYARIGVSNLSGSETFTAEYHKSGCPNSSSYSAPLTKVSLIEYWDLDRSGSATADVTIYWDDSQYSKIGSTSDLRIAHYNTGTSEWEAESGTYSTSGSASLSSSQSGSITVTGVSSFSPFSFGTTDNTTNPLPIDLIGFEVSSIDHGVRLHWKTATEYNNRGFEVQRSKDMKNWETLDFVAGAGNSNTPQQYSFIDYEPQPSNYYRLKQSDYDGTVSYSPVRWISLQESTQQVIYPNPVKSSLNFTHAAQIRELWIYDGSGRLMLHHVQPVNSIDVREWKAGLYFMRSIDTTGHQHKYTFVKE